MLFRRGAAAWSIVPVQAVCRGNKSERRSSPGVCHGAGGVLVRCGPRGSGDDVVHVTYVRVFLLKEPNYRSMSFVFIYGKYFFKHRTSTTTNSQVETKLLPASFSRIGFQARNEIWRTKDDREQWL